MMQLGFLLCMYARPRAVSTAISKDLLTENSCGSRKASANEPPVMSSAAAGEAL